MHFFNIATNLTNGPFMIGYETDPDNFYLTGKTVADSPQVSCRIFDSNGSLLFSMTENSLTKGDLGRLYVEADPGKFLMVKDYDGSLFLKIETRQEGPARVSYLQGMFFDKHGKLAAKGDERGLLVNCPLRM